MWSSFDLYLEPLFKKWLHKRAHLLLGETLQAFLRGRAVYSIYHYFSRPHFPDYVHPAPKDFRGRRIKVLRTQKHGLKDEVPVEFLEVPHNGAYVIARCGPVDSRGKIVVRCVYLQNRVVHLFQGRKHSGNVQTRGIGKDGHPGLRIIDIPQRESVINYSCEIRIQRRLAVSGKGYGVYPDILKHAG